MLDALGSTHELREGNYYDLLIFIASHSTPSTQSVLNPFLMT